MIRSGDAGGVDDEIEFAEMVAAYAARKPNATGELLALFKALDKLSAKLLTDDAATD